MAAAQQAHPKLSEEAFRELVARMRHAQKAYQAWHGDAFTKSTLLSSAKMLEMRLDAELRQANKIGLFA